MSAVVCTDAAVTMARKFARITTEFYSNQNQRVSLEEVFDLFSMPFQQKLLVPAFERWLKLAHKARFGLALWIADENISAATFAARLTEFANYAEMVVAVAKILRSAITVIRTYGWTQGPVSNEDTGFDLLAATLRAQGNDSASLVRLAVLQSLRDGIAATGVTGTIVDWNAEPGRTVEQVINLLATCAADVETL